MKENGGHGKDRKEMEEKKTRREGTERKVKLRKVMERRRGRNMKIVKRERKRRAGKR